MKGSSVAFLLVFIIVVAVVVAYKKDEKCLYGDSLPVATDIPETNAWTGCRMGEAFLEYPGRFVSYLCKEGTYMEDMFTGVMIAMTWKEQSSFHAAIRKNSEWIVGGHGEGLVFKIDEKNGIGISVTKDGTVLDTTYFPLD